LRISVTLSRLSTAALKKSVAPIGAFLDAN
jgi:hypothetical protein